MNYHSMHRKVRRVRGPASDQPCYLCEGPATDWAYEHGDPAEIQGEHSRGGLRRYSLDVERYVPLCRSCHRIMDQPARIVPFLADGARPVHLASLCTHTDRPGSKLILRGRGDRAPRLPFEASEKRCPRCATTRPASEFSPDRSKRDGLASRCRPCVREISRDYYVRNHEAKAAKNRRDRERAIEIYGGECVRCGSSDRLEFDHANHDGKAHRATGVMNVGRLIARLGGRLPDWDLRLLCWDCHRVGICTRRPWSEQRAA